MADNLKISNFTPVTSMHGITALAGYNSTSNDNVKIKTIDLVNDIKRGMTTGLMLFNLTTNTSIAPNGANVNDLVQNLGTTTYTIGGISMSIGDVGRITSLSPFTVVKEGNNRGATGSIGSTGATGASAYVHIRWGTSLTPVTLLTSPNDYIGIVSTNSATAPTSYTGYQWFKYKGEQGATGQTGANGNAATINVGNVATTAPGTQAKVTNRGTTSAAIFDFEIPAGFDGTGAGDMTTNIYDPQNKKTDIFAQLNLKAPLASPSLTGIPIAPTNTTPGTSTTQLATTAFVHQKFKLQATNDFTTSTLLPGQWGGVY